MPLNISCSQWRLSNIVRAMVAIQAQDTDCPPPGHAGVGARTIWPSSLAQSCTSRHDSPAGQHLRVEPLAHKDRAHRERHMARALGSVHRERAVVRAVPQAAREVRAAVGGALRMPGAHISRPPPPLQMHVTNGEACAATCPWPLQSSRVPHTTSASYHPSVALHHAPRRSATTSRNSAAFRRASAHDQPRICWVIESNLCWGDTHHDPVYHAPAG